MSFSCRGYHSLLNWHRQVFGQARPPCMQMGDRSWAKEPGSVPWAQRKSKEREWRVRGELYLCEPYHPVFPSLPAGLPPSCSGGILCAPGSLHCVRANSPGPPPPQLHSCSHPRTQAARPDRRASPQEAQSASEGGRRAPTWSGRRRKRSAGPGSSLPRLRDTGVWSGRRAAGQEGPASSSAPGSRTAARAKLAGGRRGSGRSARPRGDRSSSIGHSPFIRAARSSEPGRRTSEQSAPRAGEYWGARLLPGRGRAALWAQAMPPRSGLTTRASAYSLLQEAGARFPGHANSCTPGWAESRNKR